MSINVLFLIMSCLFGDMLFKGNYENSRPAMLSATLYVLCVFSGMINIVIVEMSKKSPELSKITIK